MAYSGAFGQREPERISEPELFSEESSVPTEKPSPPQRNRRPVLDLGELFRKTEAVGMETDDLLLALVLYLMYRESGDTDLLIMLGVLLLS